MIEDSSTTANRIIDKLGIGKWYDKERIDVILNHLTSVIHRMIENHEMSALFVITDDEHIDECTQQFKMYPIQASVGNESITNSDNLEKISRSYKKINSNTAFFLFSSSGKYYGIQYSENDYKDSIILSINAFVERQPEYVAFFAEGSKKSIRIYHKGRVAADYYLSEGTGNWRLRFRKDLETIFEYAHISEAKSSEFADIVLDLSYRRIGALLIISDEGIEEDIQADEPIDNIRGKYVARIPQTIVRDLASLDGALLIKKNGQIVSAGNILKIKDTDVPDTIRILIKRSQKGARHNAAASFASRRPEACVVVVSENRGISMLYGNRALMWNDEMISQDYS